MSAYIGICFRCGFKIKKGEWYASSILHFYCATTYDLKKLKEITNKELYSGLNKEQIKLLKKMKNNKVNIEEWEKLFI